MTHSLEDPHREERPKLTKIEDDIIDKMVDEVLRPRKRHPGEFYDHPSNEQMEYFKRGGR
ncbi:MAG: hypothetical protein IMZ61_14405 [Planctomycetes bacterium]|nr:hypothetical protein [Planctomycetota bacterium]